MRKTAVLISMVILGLLSFAFPHIANAVELDPGCTVYDFTVDDYDWQDVGIAPRDGATYVTSTGWRKAAGKIGIQIELAVTLPENHHISYLRWTINRSGNSAGLEAAAGRLRYLDSTVYDTYRTDYPVNGTVNREYDNLNVAPVDALRFIADGTSSSTVTLLYFEVCVTEDSDAWLKPLQNQDTDDSWGMYVNDVVVEGSEDTVHLMSTSPGKPVHNIAAGTVTKVERLTISHCESRLKIQPINLSSYLPGFVGCPVFVPASLTGGAAPSVYFLQEEQFQVPIFDTSGPTVRGVWRVLVEDGESNEFEYFVGDANNHVSEGDVIERGCVLGKTVELDGFASIIPIPVPVNLPFGDADQGFAAVSYLVGGSPTDVIDLLVIDPKTGSECGSDPDKQACLGDASLRNPSDWATSGGVSWNDPGVTLGSRASISTVMNLNANRHPKLRVSARNVEGTGMLFLKLGGTTATHQVTSQQFQAYELAGAAHTPDAGGFFTIFIQNDSSAIIELEWVCVTFTKDENLDDYPPPPPGQCVFVNHSFSNGTGAWTVSGNVSSGDGEIRVPDNQTFGQDITLYPDGESSQTYTITANAALVYYNTYTPDPDDTTANVDLEMDFPAVTSWDLIQNRTFGDFAQSNNLVMFQDTFVVSSETTGTFAFRVTFNNKPSTVYELAVRDVCIHAGEPDDPEPLPWEDRPPEPEPADPFEEVCEANPKPTSNDLGQWTTWHWNNLNGFFQCDLMVFLNTQYRTLQNYFRTSLWVARWFMASWSMGVDWMEAQFFPWFAGMLSNISPGTIVIEEEESCDWWNIPCHLASLASGALDLIDFFIRELIEEALGPLVDFIISTLTRIVDLIFTIISELLSAVLQIIIDIIFLLVYSALELLIRARNVILDLIFAWNNATPTPLPGMPDCDTPGNNILCWFVWINDNTILAGDLGQLIIPLLSSLIWILMAIQFAKEIRKMVLRMAGLI